MADTTDTPDTSKTAAPRPATRRRAPRKTSAPKSAAPAKSKSSGAARPAAAVAKPAAKPRATARAAAPRAVKTAPPPAAKAPAARQKAARPTTTALSGTKWNVAAIAGGVAAIGATAIAALLSLRGSTAKSAAPAKGSKKHDEPAAEKTE